jgi:predicted ATPase
LRFLNYLHGMRAEYHTAIELGEQMLRQARCGEEPMSVALAHLALGWVLLPVGEFSDARAHLEHMLSLVDPERRSDVPGLDPRVAALTWLAWSLWLLGYPDQALQRGRESVILARQLDHPFTLVHALGIGGAMVHAFRREAQAAQPHIEEEIRLSNEHGFAFYLPAADTHQGFSQIWGGQADLGIVHLRRGLAGWEAQGSKAYRESSYVQLADAHQKVGATEEGLDALAVAEDAMHETGEHWFDAELYRVKGELGLVQGDEVEAEAHLHKAVEIARQQSARSLELRATMSLCRLWKQQGRLAAARRMLTEIYDWFTEGFETLDLKEAKALLDELSGD